MEISDTHVGYGSILKSTWETISYVFLNSERDSVLRGDDNIVILRLIMSVDKDQ